MKKKTFLNHLFKRPKNTEQQLENLGRDEKEMIKGVIELGDTTVKEVLIPRIDVTFLSDNIDFDEMMEKITENGYSRFPVFHETIDNVIGILYIKDLLHFITKNKMEFSGKLELGELVRKPYFVPETKKLDGLLKEFKRRRVHIAVAVDEYGGVSGIICMEDIIEEIVGNIQDEFDTEVEDILEINNKTYLCDARASIDELNETLGLSLPNADFDTLGGFVFDLFGKIPVRYEKVSLGNVDLIIHNMDGHKIKTIKIQIKDNAHEET